VHPEIRKTACLQPRRLVAASNIFDFVEREHGERLLRLNLSTGEPL
jgi:hypothetical protein